MLSAHLPWQMSTQTAERVCQNCISLKIFPRKPRTLFISGLRTSNAAHCCAHEIGQLIVKLHCLLLRGKFQHFIFGVIFHCDNGLIGMAVLTVMPTSKYFLESLQQSLRSRIMWLAAARRYPHLIQRSEDHDGRRHTVSKAPNNHQPSKIRIPLGEPP